MTKNNVNTLTITAETGYNQVIQRENFKPSIYARFAFTAVNCEGDDLEQKVKSWFRAWLSKACECVLHKTTLNLPLFSGALTHAAAL